MSLKLTHTHKHTHTHTHPTSLPADESPVPGVIPLLPTGWGLGGHSKGALGSRNCQSAAEEEARYSTQSLTLPSLPLPSLILLSLTLPTQI